jgi:hypothetical protein
MRHIRLFIFYSALAVTVTARAEDDPSPPNGGRAEQALRTAGEVAGAVAGGVAGDAIAGPKGGMAGSAIGEKAGGAVGTAGGQVLDRHAVENHQSGRGGPDDPRYDPSTLFNQR